MLLDMKIVHRCSSGISRGNNIRGSWEGHLINRRMDSAVVTEVNGRPIKICEKVEQVSPLWKAYIILSVDFMSK